MSLKAEATWYKHAIIYQVHVRTFSDANDDGIGDFAGLAQRLDYLQELGVSAIWLMPFFPSPLRDDGYDISDYKSVHPSYGTLEDFKKFLSIAHGRPSQLFSRAGRCSADTVDSDQKRNNRDIELGRNGGHCRWRRMAEA